MVSCKQTVHGFFIWLVGVASGGYFNSYVVMSPLFATWVGITTNDIRLLLAPFYVALVSFGLSCWIAVYVTESAGTHLVVSFAGCIILMGAFLSASGLIINSFTTVTIGFSLFGGLGFGFCYMGPQLALYKWFPDVDRSVLSSWSFSGSAIGPLIFIPSVRALTRIEFFLDNPDSLFLGLGMVVAFVLIVCAFFSANPDPQIPSTKLRPNPFIVQMEFPKSSEKIPKLHFTLKEVLRSRNFWCTVLIYQAVIVPSLLSVPVALQGIMMSINIGTLEFETSVAMGLNMFLAHYAGTAIGLLGGGFASRFLDMKIFYGFVLVLQLMFYSIANYGTAFGTINESITVVAWVSVSIEGLYYGIASGSLHGYFSLQYGEYLATVLQGHALSLLPIFVAILGSLFLTVDSYESLVDRFVASYIVITLVALVSLFFINTDPYRKLLYKLHENKDEKVIFGCCGSDIEISQNWSSMKFVTRKCKIERILNLVASEGKSTDQAIIACREDIPWLRWSLKTSITIITISVPLLCILMFWPPMFSVFKGLRDASEVNTTERCTQDESEYLKDHFQRFILYTLLGAVTTYASIGFVSVTSLRTLLKPLRVLTERLSSAELFVFETPNEDQQLYSVITEVTVLKESTDSLRSALRGFTSFVPEAIVRLALRDKKFRRPYGTRRKVTILFMDIIPLSTSLEVLGDEELTSAFSLVFAELSSAVSQFHGEIGELLEDGLLAFWNTPEDVPDHASMAFQCAVKLQQVTRELSLHFESKFNFVPLVSRIGLHSGM